MRNRAAICLVLGLVLSACGEDGAAPTTRATAPTTSASSAPVTTAAAATTRIAATTSTAVATTQISVPIGCSMEGAAHEGDRLSDQSTLPSAVGAVRQAIWDAVVGCDFVGLQALAGADPEFIFSFGYPPGAADFAAYLIEYESYGEAPLQVLGWLLNAPFGTEVFEGVTYYVWPSAAAYPDWASVPQADRAAISGLYGADFPTFDFENAYFGGRVAIGELGVWSYFILGGD